MDDSDDNDDNKDNDDNNDNDDKVSQNLSFRFGEEFREVYQDSNTYSAIPTEVLKKIEAMKKEQEKERKERMKEE